VTPLSDLKSTYWLEIKIWATLLDIKLLLLLET